MEQVITAIVGLGGVAAGALLQFMLDRRSNQETRALEMKSEAYSDYMEAVAAVSYGVQDGHSRFAAAKAKICVFGDAPVIEALHEFERVNRSLGDPSSQPSFVKLVTVMRNHSIAGGLVDSSKTKEILLGFSNRVS